MRTGFKISGIMGIFLGFAVFSCTTETVETEMQRWCDCKRKAKTDASLEVECAEMVKAIARKYEFDPQAAVKIQTKILECQQN